MPVFRVDLKTGKTTPFFAASQPAETKPSETFAVSWVRIVGLISFTVVAASYIQIFPELDQHIVPLWNTSVATLFIATLIAALCSLTTNIWDKSITSNDAAEYPKWMAPFLIIFAAVVSVFTGILEEVSYRWAGLTAFCSLLAIFVSKDIAVIIAVTLTTTIFAVHHSQRGKSGVVLALVTGLVLAVVAINFGLVTAVAAHAAFDFTGSIVTLVKLEKNRK